MKIHYIQHADFEGLGAIETWAKAQGHKISCTKIYAGESLPDINDFDVLISMGGPQSPLTMEQNPYLEDEIELIKKALDANKYVIGFCLGAQLMSLALGAATEKSPHKEVGVFPIHLTKAAQDDRAFKNFPSRFPVLHWHNDMPGVPKDAKIFASSAGCPRQIIKYNDKAYGFQCHFEPTQADVERMLEEDPGMLEASEYTQSEAQMIENDFAAMNKLTYLFFDNWLGEQK